MRQREEAGGEDGRRERGTVMGGRVRERERERGGRNETPVNDNIPSPRYRFFAAFVALLDATTARG